MLFFMIRRKGGKNSLPFAIFTQKNDEPTKSFWNYCCPVKNKLKALYLFPIGVAAVLLIQGLGFQFQTVSIIKCAFLTRKAL